MFESSDIPVRMAEELNGGRQEGDMIAKRCSNYVQGVESDSSRRSQDSHSKGFVLLSDCLMLFDGRASMTSLAIKARFCHSRISPRKMKRGL